MLTWNAVERGFESLLELVARDERLQQEFEHSRGEFFVDAAAAQAPGAERRHLEWFLLERPSSVLGAVPVQAWREHLQGAFPGASAELAASFLGTLPGAFEVTSLVPGEGFWVRDLFTQGEHPIAEAQVTTIDVGDLLVGRLFPAVGGTFLLSPAVSVFRNPDLVSAVRADLEGMRVVRRGVLRVQQLELERLFHARAAAVDVPSTEEVRTRARDDLIRLGLTRQYTDGVLRRVQRAARSGDGRAVTEILNRLAFETGIDLNAARLVLTELWERERRERDPGSASGEPPEGVDPRAALEAFDRGRAEGRDLEQLFRQLERDLGVEVEANDEAEDETEEVVPDFPGVVGAMVEEFLWDVAREQGEERGRSFGVLRALGTYAKDIGVFDELDHRRLLDFTARWLLDESGLTGVADAARLLDALEAFCRWCEERHDLPLAKQFGPTLATLKSSLPRHIALRQQVRDGAGAGAYRVVRVDPDRVLVRDVGGKEQTVLVSPAQSQHLRDGDLVRLERRSGAAVLGASYPGELGSLLERG